MPRRLKRPAEEPSKWFIIRPDLPNAQISFRLEFRRYGWALMIITLNGVTAEISLADEDTDPFEDIIAWGHEIEHGCLPVLIEIDEEVSVAILSALRTEDQERILLRIAHRYSDDIMLEGIVSRNELVFALKTELRCSFATNFDPREWDSDFLPRCRDIDVLKEDEEDPDPEVDYIHVRDIVLNHPWLAEQKCKDNT